MTSSVEVNKDLISLGINIGAMNTVYSRCLKINDKFTTEVLLSDVASRTFPSQICYTNYNRLYGETSNSSMKQFYKTSFLNLSRLFYVFFDNNDINPIDEKEFEYLNENSYQKKEKKICIYNNETCDSYILLADYLSLINKYFFEEHELKYDTVTFSVPDFFTFYQKNILKLIAEAINMKNINIINESTAITIYYGYNKYRDLFNNVELNQEPKHVIFVDIGHSKTSFIYSIFSYDNFEVINVKTLSSIGGRNFDKVLINKIIENFKIQNSIKNDDKEFESYVKSHKKLLMDAVQKGRRVLTVNDVTTISIESFYKEEDLKYTISRENFQKLIFDYTVFIKKEFSDFISSIPATIKSKIIIEIAGELMRIPILQEIIEECFSKKIPVFKTILIDECYSIGAGLYNYYINKQFPNKFVKNVLNLKDTICFTILEQNKEIYKENIYQNNLFHNFKIEQKDFLKFTDLKIGLRYEKNKQFFPEKYHYIYLYKINIKKLKEENKDLMKMSFLRIRLYSEGFEIKLKLFMIISNKEIECKYSNGFELDEKGMINNKLNKIKEEISKTILNHDVFDQQYYIYVNKKNSLVQYLFKCQNSKILSEKEAKDYNSKIRKLDKENNLKIKIQEIEKIEKEIMKKTNGVNKEEEKFNAEKQKLIEQIKMARDNYNKKIEENKEILKESRIFNEYKETLGNSNPISKKGSKVIDDNKNNNDEKNKNPLQKQLSIASNQSENEFEFDKLCEKNPDEKFFDNLIEEINNIEFENKILFEEYKKNWKKIIEEKKNLSKKDEVLFQINTFKEELIDYKIPLEKIEKKFNEGLISPDEALMKIASLKKINEEKNSLKKI